MALNVGLALFLASALLGLNARRKLQAGARSATGLALTRGDLPAAPPYPPTPLI